jgi:rubredoxin
MPTKTCPGCKVEKDLTEFYRNKTAKDGRQVRCKECQLAYQAANREAARRRSAEWRRKHGVPEPPRDGLA